MSSDSPVAPPPTFIYSDFTTVKSRKKKNKHHIKELPSLSTQLSKLREQLKQDEWFEACSLLLQSSWGQLTNGSGPPKAMLCLGLGSPTTSHNARVQLAFLTEICQLLKATDAVSIYDPVFTPEDVDVLEQLHMNVLSETNTSHYELKTPTLCFMPHCDIELYEALLRTNAQRQQSRTDISGTALTNLYLVGNVLQEYIENKPKRVMETDFPYLLKIAPNLECTPLPASSTWPTAFNNTSIQFVRCSSSEHEDHDSVNGNNVGGSERSGSNVVENNDGDIRHTKRQRERSSEGDDRLKGGAGGGDNYGTDAPLGEPNNLPDEAHADRGGYQGMSSIRRRP
ncbi:SRR1-domain-containing protein [Panaeolus papilionaceus]|nr:SRR1-domain-containing protein [Panaeolus papilionaceus]